MTWSTINSKCLNPIWNRAKKTIVDHHPSRKKGATRNVNLLKYIFNFYVVQGNGGSLKKNQAFGRRKSRIILVQLRVRNDQWQFKLWEESIDEVNAYARLLHQRKWRKYLIFANEG
jgi:hypothetical protein